MSVDNDEILTGVGLESIRPPDEAFAPEFIRDGERVWLTVAHKGKRVNVCEVSLGRLMLLNAQAARIAFALAHR